MCLVWHPRVLSEFREEMPRYWGRRWKANTTIRRLRMVLLHRPGREFQKRRLAHTLQPHGSSLEALRMAHRPDLK